MSAYASLDPATSTVVPGAAASTLTLRVRNTTDQVEEYQLTAVGPLARWTRLSPERLRIYPGDEGTATVTVEVPRTSDAAAGPTPLGIRVVPQVNSQLTDVAECSVTITPFGELRAQMTPVTLRARLSGFVRISVENRGNMPLMVNLEGKDDEDVLRFDKGGIDAVRVPAATLSRPQLRIRSVRRRLIARQVRYPFAVTVSPVNEESAAGALPVELRGTYIQRSLLSRWVVLLVLLLFLAALLYYLLYLLPSLQNPVLGLQSPPGAVAVAPPPAGQTPPQQNGQDDRQVEDQNLTVTIRHGNVALASIVDPRGDGGPAPVLRPAERGEGDQIWQLLQVGDGRVAVVPASATDNVLEQPNPADTSQLGLTRIGRGAGLAREQTWELRPVGESQVVFVNSATGDCMTDAGVGRAVQGATCTNDRAQEQVWQLTRS